MFLLLGILFVALGFIPLVLTFKNAKKMNKEEYQNKLKTSVIVIIIDIVLLILINVFFQLYTDFHWFDSLDYSDRFLTALTTQIILFIGAGVISFSFLIVILKTSIPKNSNGGYNRTVTVVSLVSSVILASWVSGLWERALLFLNQTPVETVDPIFNTSINFYLFSLPIYGDVLSWLTFLFIISTALLIISSFVPQKFAQVKLENEEGEELPFQQRSSEIGGNLKRITKHLFVSVALLLIVIALNYFLNNYRLMYSDWGAVNGAGYVDVHFRTLGFNVSAIILLITSLILILGVFIGKIRDRIMSFETIPNTNRHKLKLKSITVPVIIIGLLIIFNLVIPWLVMELIVKPNEITLEKQYLEHNINFTQEAYRVDEENIQEKEFMVEGELKPSVTQQNPKVLDNIRLWDSRALLDNLKEQQEIRLYYEFFGVDIDRYHLEDDYTQVMLSVRELEKSELAEQSQTWVAKHLKYTHGFGLTLIPVHDFLKQGKPNLLIKNIPPQTKERFPLQIKHPEIYYGERTRDHVYVNTSQKEFNYPAGDKNVFSTYDGEGGITINTWIKRFIYAWRFDGYKLLFSGYFNRDSKIMFRRHIRERVEALAPFLKYDDDPYAVVTNDGHIKYIIDAYTTSAFYPYSESYYGKLYEYNGLNYMRNSVKVVVDAYDGSVNFYVINKEDPIINTYRNIFPDLFQPIEEMSDYMYKHIRYPIDYLTVQADIFSTYHMDDAETFYQREDVWQFATERYRENFQYVEPYYLMLKFPGEEDIEFSLILPFTPKNKNVINAWMAGRCDPENYGKLTIYNFPKGIEVLGPRQIEARIDQNTEMSRNMTLWGQRGSEVIRGNLLTIPLFVDNTLYLLYVEPIFLQAEDAQLPEIKRVVVADQSKVVWAETFDMAINKLLGITEEEAKTEREKEPTPEDDGVPPTIEELVQDAQNAFNSFQQLRGESNFVEAEKEFNKLQKILNRLVNATTED